MTYPAWTPASRPGIIPLHPLTFGTILGRSFSALRQNPRVLLGFAMGVQVIAYTALFVVVGLVAWSTFSRLDTLREGTDEFDAVLTGSIVLTAGAAFVLSLALGALSAIVQGIVVRDVSHAALAEKLPLRELWRRFRPVAWRLIGYSFLLVLVVLLIVAAVAAGVFAIGTAALPIAIGMTVFLVLGSFPLYFWLSTKLLLVPSAIVLEGATIRQAIARSWRLTRGRFWAALGVIVIISVAFSALGQVVNLPFSFLTSGLTTIITPTGDPDAQAWIAIIIAGVAAQALLLVVQSVALVVQSTAAALVYIDCRMRHEGLDLDLLQYVERRDAGAPDLADPYTVGIGRVLAPRPPMPVGYPMAGAASAAPGYPQPFPGYPMPGPGYAMPGPGYPQGAPYPQPTAAGPVPGYAPTAPPPASPASYPPPTGPAYPSAEASVSPAPPAPAPQPAAPTSWTAPGAPDSGDPESPWR